MLISRFAAAALLLIVPSTFAHSQSYPTKPVQIIIGTPAGGPSDVAGRFLAEQLSTMLGQRFVVENRPAANCTLAAEMVANSDRAGYTLFFCSASVMTINPHMNKAIRWDPRKSFAAVGQLGTTPIAFGVPKTSPANNLAELLTAAKARPRAIKYGAQTGSMAHFAGELLKSGAKVDMTFIPFRGGGQLQASALAGDIDVIFDGVTPLVPHFQSGALKPMAVTGEKRLAALPNVPAAIESVPGFEATSWFGVFGPAGMDPAAIKVLNQAINKMLEQPDTRERLVKLGVEVEGGGPDVLQNRVMNDFTKFGEIAERAGIKME